VAGHRPSSHVRNQQTRSACRGVKCEGNRSHVFLGKDLHTTKGELHPPPYTYTTASMSAAATPEHRSACFTTGMRVEFPLHCLVGLVGFRLADWITANRWRFRTSVCDPPTQRNVAAFDTAGDITDTTIQASLAQHRIGRAWMCSLATFIRSFTRSSERSTCLWPLRRTAAGCTSS
jgi:hypothetical protein